MKLKIFKYKGVLSNGKKVKGCVKAVSMEQARESLPRLETIDYLRDGSEDFNVDFLFKTIRMNKKQLAVFIDQVCILIDTGYSQVEAFMLLARHGDKGTQSVAEIINEEISEGITLSEAFKKHKGVMGRDLSSQVRASEESSNLTTVLRSIAGQLEAEAELSSKIRGAMIMPVVMLMMFVVLGVVMSTSVLPVMVELLASLGAETPLIMTVVLKIVELIKEHTIQFLLITISLVSSVSFLLLKPFRVHWDLYKIKMPVIGKILILRDLVNLYKFLSMNLDAGIPLHVGIYTAVETVTNKAFKKELNNISDDIIIYASELSQSLISSNFVSELDRQTIMIGERSGTLSEQLRRMGEIKEKILNHSIETLSDSLQPTLTIVLGVLVGTVAIMLYGTIYGVIGSI